MNVVGPHWKCADDAPWCSHEKNVRVCASGKVFCVHIPTHSREAQGDLLVPSSGVDEAEGRVREQVGEEKIAGNGRDGTPKRDMTPR